MANYLTPLSRAELAKAGIPEPWSFGIRDRVRFHELDALNHVNNATYLSWFESFRLPYLKARGVTNYDAASPELVLKDIRVSFHAPMYLGEDYIVTGRTRAFRTNSFTMEYAVFSDGLRTEGRAIIVLLKRDGTGKQRIASSAVENFILHDNALDER